MGAAAAAEGCRLCPVSSIELDLGHSPMLLTASSLKDNHMSFKTCACVCVWLRGAGQCKEHKHEDVLRRNAID